MAQRVHFARFQIRRADVRQRARVDRLASIAPTVGYPDRRIRGKLQGRAFILGLQIVEQDRARFPVQKIALNLAALV